MKHKSFSGMVMLGSFRANFSTFDTIETISSFNDCAPYRYENDDHGEWRVVTSQ